MLLQANEVEATAGAGVECCCRLVRWHTNSRTQQGMVWNAAAGY
jgi:hypothetical protein